MPKIKTNSDIEYFYEVERPITPNHLELENLIDDQNPDRKKYLADFKKLSGKPRIMDKLLNFIGGMAVIVGIFGTMAAFSILIPFIGPLFAALAAGASIAGTLMLTMISASKFFNKVEKFWAKLSGHDKLHQLNLTEAQRLDTQLAPFLDAFKQKQAQVKAAEEALREIKRIKIAVQAPDGKLVAAEIATPQAAQKIATAATPVRPAVTLAGPKKAGVKITSGPIQA